MLRQAQHERFFITRVSTFYFLLSVLCLLSSAFCPLAVADTLYLKTGDSIKGLVVEEHRDRIVLSTEEGERTILRGGIDEIFYAEPERNDLYLGHQALEQREYALARGFYQKALQTHPAFEEAEDALRRLEDVEKKREEPPVPDPLEALWRRWGLALEDIRGSAGVAHLREDSAAAQAGLERSDVLVSAWGESLLFLPAQEVAGILLGPSGTQVRIAVWRTVPVPAALRQGWPEGRGAASSKLSSGEVPRSGASSSRSRWPQWTLEMGRLGLAILRADSAGAAAMAGLKPGDRIVQLNGQPTRYLPLGQARRIVRESRDRGLVLVIHRDLMVHRE